MAFCRGAQALLCAKLVLFQATQLPSQCMASRESMLGRAVDPLQKHHGCCDRAHQIALSSLMARVSATDVHIRKVHSGRLIPLLPFQAPWLPIRGVAIR